MSGDMKRYRTLACGASAARTSASLHGSSLIRQLAKTFKPSSFGVASALTILESLVRSNSALNGTTLMVKFSRLSVYTVLSFRCWHACSADTLSKYVTTAVCRSAAFRFEEFIRTPMISPPSLPMWRRNSSSSISLMSSPDT